MTQLDTTVRRARLSVLLVFACLSVAAQDKPVGQPGAVVALRRTGCFGTCPIYEVSIFPDGRVLYEGRQFVATKGQKEGRIEKTALDSLIKKFMDADFFGMKDHYWATVTDNPTTFTMLNYGGRTKTIEDYVAGPAALKELEQAVDRVSNTQQWICSKEGPQRPGCSDKP